MYEWVQQVKGMWECEADSYRTLLGVFSWIQRFPADIAEAAASQALHSGIFSVRGFKAIVSRCIADRDKARRRNRPSTASTSLMWRMAMDTKNSILSICDSLYVL